MVRRSSIFLVLSLILVLFSPARAWAQSTGGGIGTNAVATPACDEYCIPVFEDGEKISNACLLALNTDYGEGIECRATQSQCWFNGICVEVTAGSMIIDEMGVKMPSCLELPRDNQLVELES